jgi:hypothetical protein
MTNLIGAPEGKTSLGRLNGRWEDNIKINFRGKDFGDVDLINMVQCKSSGGFQKVGKFRDYFSDY